MIIIEDTYLGSLGPCPGPVQDARTEDALPARPS